MAKIPGITQAAAQDLLTQLETDFNAGTAAVIRGLTGALPANADDVETGTLLFTLTCNALIFTSKTDANPGALGTFAAITDDSSADATGTLTYFRILTQTAGTIVFQGSAGVGTFDMNINTDAITAGSTVSCTSATITVPEK